MAFLDLGQSSMSMNNIEINTSMNIIVICYSCPLVAVALQMGLISMPKLIFILILFKFAKNVLTGIQCESKNTLCGLRFSDIFYKRLRIFNRFLHTFLFSLDLQFFIQLYPTLIKLCHLKRDYVVHVICSKCPPSAETHAFRRLRKSLIGLLIVVCGKSLENKHFYNVNKHVW